MSTVNLIIYSPSAMRAKASGFRFWLRVLGFKVFGLRLKV